MSEQKVWKIRLDLTPDEATALLNCVDPKEHTLYGKVHNQVFRCPACSAPGPLYFTVTEWSPEGEVWNADSLCRDCHDTFKADKP